ncbi:MAG: MFS transporter [Pseudomonadota bacterium]
MNSQKYKHNILKIFSIQILMRMHFIAAVLIPFFTDWGKINFTKILFIQAWFMIWVFLLEIPTGTIADFFGRKVSIILGALLGSIGFLVYASTPNFYIFLLGEFILAVSVALISGSIEAIAYDSLKKLDQEATSKKIFANLESFSLASMVIGALLGSVFAKFFGLRETVLIQAIPAFLAFIVACTLLEPKTQKENKEISYIETLFKGVKYFLKHKVLIILASDFISVGALAFLIIWFYQAILKLSGVDIVYFGIVHSLLVISQIIIIKSFNIFEKFLGSKRAYLFFSSIITGVFYIILGLISYLPIIILSIILCTGFGMSRRPLFINYMNKHIPSEQRATILSTVSMFRTLAIAIVYPLAGFLADISIQMTMLIIGATLIVLAFVSKVKEEHLIN